MIDWFSGLTVKNTNELGTDNPPEENGELILGIYGAVDAIKGTIQHRCW